MSLRERLKLEELEGESLLTKQKLPVKEVIKDDEPLQTVEKEEKPEKLS